MPVRYVSVLLFVVLATACSRDDAYPVLPRPTAAYGGMFPDDPPPVAKAVIDGNPARLRDLFKAGGDPNARWSRHGDHFPLELAIEICDIYRQCPQSYRTEIVRVLLEHGADPNARWCPFESRGEQLRALGIAPCTSEEGATPLIMAAITDRADIVYLLLDAGANPKLADMSGATALDYARSESVFYLLQAAIFPDATSRNTETLKFFRRPIPAEVLRPWDESSLARAIMGGFESPLMTVPPVPPPGARPPFSYPAYVARVRLRLAIGADPNERLTWEGVDWTPLALALQQPDPGVIATLLDHAADPNQRWCVRVDAEPSRRTRSAECTLANGMTPLMYAGSLGYPELERLLLQHGADASARDWNGRTAADYAAAARTAKPVPRTSN